MTDLEKALITRFGEERVQSIPVQQGEIPLLALDLELKSPVTVIVTNGLSDYKMPVPEAEKGNEYNELYFCLPNYWKWEELDNPQMNWVFTWIQKLSSFVVNRETWFGHGHTIPCGKDMQSLSQTMKQNHFFMIRPILLEEELAPLELNDRTVQFLALVPIFADEMDYKQGKGTVKFLKKLNNNGVTEKLDDFRANVLNSRLRFWRS